MVVGDCTAGNGISNANNIAKRCLMKTRLSWCCTLLASFMDFNGIIYGLLIWERRLLPAAGMMFRS
jgi:hypothetical protein